LPNWPTLAETVIEIQKSRECTAQEAWAEVLEDLASGQRDARGAYYFPRGVKRGYLRDHPIGGGYPAIRPIPVEYWVAVKFGTGPTVDYTTSKGSGGPPAGAGQYLEIWISPSARANQKTQRTEASARSNSTGMSSIVKLSASL
jgi:hypothetical protein